MTLTDYDRKIKRKIIERLNVKGYLISIAIAIKWHKEFDTKHFSIPSLEIIKNH